MKRCPHCARQIDDAEAVCQDCVRESKEVVTSAPPSKEGLQSEMEGLQSDGSHGASAASDETALVVRNDVGWKNWQLAVITIGGIVAGAVAVTLLGRAPATEDPSAAVERSADPRASEVARPASPVRPESDPFSGPKWIGSRQPVWVDGSRTIQFELPAENDVLVWRDRVRPVLTVRCLSARTEAFVVVNWPPSVEEDADHHTARISFDDEAEIMEPWVRSVGYDALFAPDGVALARQLASVQKMRFGFTPYNASPALVEFDVRGFDELIDPLARTCKWKP